MKRAYWFLIIIVVGGGGWFWANEGPAAVRNAPPRSGPIVALGDSLTYGYGAPEGEGYVDLLAEMIGKPIVNRGDPGDTIGGAYGRLRAEVLALRPSIVIVLIGGNDYLRRHDMTQALNQLDKMVGEIQDAGAVVVLVGLEGLVPFSGYGKRFKEIARGRETAFVPDILDGILLNKEMMHDSIHPNAKGYRLMAERIAPVLKPLADAVPGE